MLKIKEMEKMIVSSLVYFGEILLLLELVKRKFSKFEFLEEYWVMKGKFINMKLFFDILEGEKEGLKFEM